MTIPGDENWFGNIDAHKSGLGKYSMFNKESYNVYMNDFGDLFVVDDSGKYWYDYELGINLNQ